MAAQGNLDRAQKAGDTSTYIEAAKVQATLAIAAAISELAQNLYKIGH